MGWMPVSPWKLNSAGQDKTATATSQKFSAVGDGTHAVLLTAKTADVRVAVGSNAVATASSTLVKTTDPPLVLGCSPGDVVAVIQDSSGGVLNVTELTH